jgi:hypothetical protein
MLVGCETDRNDQATCADLEAGVIGGKIKARKVNRLTYWVLPADWNADMEALFSTAWSRLTTDDPTSTNRLDFKIRKASAPAESACTDPAEYVQPCYSRTICQQYQGCSKSKFSCQACTPVP